MTTMKWKLERVTEDTIVATVFLGESGLTLQNAGHIRFKVGEYQIVGAALLMGSMWTKGHLAFVVEGEQEAPQ